MTAISIRGVSKVFDAGDRGRIALPLAALVVISFWLVANYHLVPSFAFDSYVKLAQPLYLWIIVRTFAIAAVVTILTALIGYPIAYYLARRAQRFRVLILTLVVLPLWTSYLVRSFAGCSSSARTASSTSSCLGLGSSTGRCAGSFTANSRSSSPSFTHTFRTLFCRSLPCWRSSITVCWRRAAISAPARGPRSGR